MEYHPNEMRIRLLTSDDRTRVAVFFSKLGTEGAEFLNRGRGLDILHDSVL